MFMDALNQQANNVATGTASTASFSPMIGNATGAVKPIEYFSNYRFSDPKQAAEFMRSKEFTDFWSKGKVDSPNVAARVEYQTKGRYAVPRFSKEQLAIDLQASKDKYLKALNNPKTLATEAELKARLNYTQSGTRAEGRFYTPVDEKKALADYIARGQRTGESIPIRVVADERVSRSSLKGYDRFKGWTPEAGGNVHEAGMGAEGARRNLSRVTGKDLGAALSSNPTEEVFLPSNMARPAAHGGSSRVAGRIADTGEIVLVGKPRVPVNTQIKANILPFVGQSMAKASPYLGVAGTGVMAYQGYQDYNSDNMMTREYGATDQFGLRAGYDMGINVLSGQQSIPQAWETQRRLVANPEWQLRNPLAATIYNTAHGNFEPLQAFASAYIPDFLK